MDQQQCRAEFSPLDSLLFFETVHGVAVNRVQDLVAQGSRQLLGVLEGVDDVDVAARRWERIGMALVNDEELEWMIVAGLRLFGNRFGDRRSVS